MIISHELKFIYIQPPKCAGSSFRLAFLEYCRENNIEAYEKYGDIVPYGHISAREVKKIVPQNIWDNYLKVSTIRCPYDSHISNYWFRRVAGRRKLSGIKKVWGDKYFGLSITCYGLIFKYNVNRICIDNRLAVDFLIRYEHLDEDIKKLEMKIGCPGLLEIFNNTFEKNNFRAPGQDIYTVYFKHPVIRARINKICEEFMGNEVVAKYFPLYRERLSRKVPEPGYFSVYVANFIHIVSKGYTKVYKWLRGRKR